MQQSQVESLRPYAVALHVERIALRMGCDQALESALEAVTALRNKESAHRAINLGVRKAAAFTASPIASFSQPSKPLFVMGLILLFVAMCAPLAAKAACNGTYNGTLRIDYVTDYTLLSGVLSDFTETAYVARFTFNAAAFVVQRQWFTASHFSEITCTFNIEYQADPVFTQGFDCCGGLAVLAATQDCNGVYSGVLEQTWPPPTGGLGIPGVMSDFQAVGGPGGFLYFTFNGTPYGVQFLNVEVGPIFDEVGCTFALRYLADPIFRDAEIFNYRDAS